MTKCRKICMAQMASLRIVRDVMVSDEDKHMRENHTMVFACIFYGAEIFNCPTYFMARQFPIPLHEPVDENVWHYSPHRQCGIFTNSDTLGDKGEFRIRFGLCSSFRNDE